MAAFPKTSVRDSSRKKVAAFAVMSSMRKVMIRESTYFHEIMSHKGPFVSG